MDEYEKFNGKVWKTGNSLVVTVPDKVAEYGGYKVGDVLKVMSKKEVQQNEKEIDKGKMQRNQY